MLKADNKVLCPSFFLRAIISVGFYIFSVTRAIEECGKHASVEKEKIFDLAVDRITDCKVIGLVCFRVGYGLS